MKNLSGSQFFLNNLQKSLSSYDLPSYQIAIPSINYKIPQNEKALILARFDGITHYKFSIKCFYNFLKTRKIKHLPFLNLNHSAFNKSSKNIDKLLNIYLSRTELKLRRVSDVIIYQSNFSKKIHEFLLGPSKIKNYIIHNGVIIPPKTKILKYKKQIDIAINASFRLGKRLSKAIKVVNYINKFHKAKLHIFGPIDSLTNISLKNLNINNCSFYNEIDREKIFEYYQNIDIGISTSVNESCSNSVLEMMSYGIPVIVTSNGGNSELVANSSFIVNESEEKNICFIEYHNPQYDSLNNINLWSDKILSCYSNLNIRSEQTYEHMRVRFDIKKISHEYANVIKNNYKLK